MELVPGHNKRTSQYAAQDSARATHTADEQNRAGKDANRSTQSHEAEHAAEKDSQRSKTMPKPTDNKDKKPFFNKAVHKACLEKGFSPEEADKFARTAPEEDEDEKGEEMVPGPEGPEGQHSEPDGDEDNLDANVKKAMDEVADIIKSGQNLFTQEQVNELSTQYRDRITLMAKSFDAATDKIRDRLHVLEKGFLAVHAGSDALVKALTESNDLHKAVSAELDDLKKSRTSTPDADPINKGEPLAGSAAEAAQAVTMIPSPNEETTPETPKTAATPARVIEVAKDKLMKGGLPPAEEKLLKAAMGEAAMGFNMNYLMNNYGRVLGDL